MQLTSDHLRLLVTFGGLHDRWARLCPLVLMALPPIAALGQPLPALADVMTWPIVLASVWCAGQITLYLAENRQSELRQQWGGRPGVRMLRHGDCCFSSRTKLMWHERLKRELGAPLPSYAAERLDPQHANDAYSFALAQCEQHFRDRIRFRELCMKRVVYEFLLNCVVVRWPGLIAAILTPLWSCTRPPMMILGKHADADLAVLLAFDPISPLVIIVSAAMVWIWAFFFTAERVHRAAWSYDHHMLECLAVHKEGRLTSSRATSSSRR